MDVRSISEVAFRLGPLHVAVIRPPSSNRAVGCPFSSDSGRYAPAEASEIYALHAMLIEMSNDIRNWSGMLPHQRMLPRS
jgi:hypothetical protein